MTDPTAQVPDLATAAASDPAPAALPPPPPAPGLLTDIDHRTPVLRRILRVLLSLASIVLFIFLQALVARRFGLTGPVAFITCAVAIYAVIFIFALVWGRIILKRVYQRMLRFAFGDPRRSAADIVRYSLGPGRILYATPGVEPIATVLALRRTDATVRIAPAKLLTPIRPLDVPIEPLMLREDNAAFRELHDALAADDPARPARIHDSRTWRRFGTPRGGWVWLFICACLFALAVLRAVAQQRVTFSVVLWGVFLGMAALPLRRRKLIAPEEWLAVSAGLVVRKPSGLTYFLRRDSALCAIATRRRHWKVAVSDGQAAEEMLVTEREFEMILRAWLSPLEPPTLDKLTDLQ